MPGSSGGTEIKSLGQCAWDLRRGFSDGNILVLTHRPTTGGWYDDKSFHA